MLQGTTDPAEVARVDGVICLCYREQQILQKWHELMELLEKKKRTLTGFSELLGMFREMESIQVEMKEMEVGSRTILCNSIITLSRNILQNSIISFIIVINVQN